MKNIIKKMEQNKFNKFAGNKDCPKCHGEGSYMYDENHGQICELCCTHPNGFQELNKEFWPEMVGKEVCVFGCGAERKIKLPVERKSNKKPPTGKPMQNKPNLGKPKELDWSEIEEVLFDLHIRFCPLVETKNKNEIKQADCNAVKDELRKAISSLLLKQKEEVIKDLIKDVKDHQDTSEDIQILAFWDQVSYWLNLKLKEENESRNR